MVRRIGVAILVFAAVGVCVRLGFWQLTRLSEKRALNATASARLALSPVAFTPNAMRDSLRGRRVLAHGSFDEKRQILLYGRERNGVPGVHVVTPLLLARDSLAVLVDRGWLPAEDAEIARPQDHPVPGPREVVGIADTLSRSGKSPFRVIESDSLLLLSMRRPDAISLAAQFPYALADLWIHEFPGKDAEKLPARDAPRPLDENMHLGYAVQWFAIGAIILFGSIALSRRRSTPVSPVSLGPPGPPPTQ